MEKVMNPVSGEVRRLPWDEFEKLIDESAIEKVHTMLGRVSPEAKGIVCYEVIDLGSPHLGHRHFMIYGPGCTYKTIEDCTKAPLGDVPSRFHYPVSYFAKEST